MRVLVCGGRDFNDQDYLRATLDSLDVVHGPFEVIIHGCAAGVDTQAALWASIQKKKVLAFSADWKTHGRAAGPIRNTQMLEEGKPDLVIAFPGGIGTANMVRQAKAANVEVIEVAQDAK